MNQMMFDIVSYQHPIFYLQQQYLKLKLNNQTLSSDATFTARPAANAFVRQGGSLSNQQVNGIQENIPLFNSLFGLKIGRMNLSLLSSPLISSASVSASSFGANNYFWCYNNETKHSSDSNTSFKTIETSTHSFLSAISNFLCILA